MREWAYKLHVSAYREIISFHRLKHEGLLELRDVVCRRGGPGRGAVVLVFDYYEHDLLGLAFMKVQLAPRQLKAIFQKLLRVVAYLHSNRVLHRDVKSRLIRRERSPQQQGRRPPRRPRPCVQHAHWPIPPFASCLHPALLVPRAAPTAPFWLQLQG